MVGGISAKTIAPAGGYYDSAAGQCIASPGSGDAVCSSYHDEGTRKGMMIPGRFPSGPALLISEPPRRPIRQRDAEDGEGPSLKNLLAGLRLLNPVSCGGLVDMCDLFEKGECLDVSADIEPAGEQYPAQFHYDVFELAKEKLHEVSRQNSCLLQGLAGVSFEKDLQYDGKPVAALYDGRTRKISINPDMVNDDVTTEDRHKFSMRHRLGHELGHHIFEHVFDNPSVGNVACTGIRDEFIAASNACTDKSTDTGDFLNAEALENEDEDFAVCFSYYVSWPEEFKRRVDQRVQETDDPKTPLARKYESMRKLFQGYVFPESGIQ